MTTLLMERKSVQGGGEKKRMGESDLKEKREKKNGLPIAVRKKKGKKIRGACNQYLVFNLKWGRNMQLRLYLIFIIVTRVVLFV